MTPHTIADLTAIKDSEKQYRAVLKAVEAGREMVDSGCLSLTELEEMLDQVGHLRRFVTGTFYGMTEYYMVAETRKMHDKISELARLVNIAIKYSEKISTKDSVSSAGFIPMPVPLRDQVLLIEYRDTNSKTGLNYISCLSRTDQFGRLYWDDSVNSSRYVDALYNFDRKGSDLLTGKWSVVSLNKFFPCNALG
jgi:hypothetical protein